jgi:anti-sigma-K factor RskA
MGEDHRTNDTAANGTTRAEDTHSVVQADLAAYALGVLDRSNCDRIERHIEECSQCRQALLEYEEVMALLPFGLPPAPPPANALHDLLRRIRNQPQEEQHGPRSARTASQAHHVRLGLRLSMPPALQIALFALVLLFGLIGWGLYLRTSGGPGLFPDQTGGEMLVTPLKGSSAAPAALGHLMIYPDTHEGELVVSGLPPLPPDRSYQLWFVSPDQTRVSGGVFRVDEHGQAVTTVNVPQPLTDYRRVGVTEEPVGGSPAPTGRNVLAGDLSPELLQP